MNTYTFREERGRKERRARRERIRKKKERKEKRGKKEIRSDHPSMHVFVNVCCVSGMYTTF